MVTSLIKTEYDFQHLLGKEKALYLVKRKNEVGWMTFVMGMYCEVC